MTDWQDEGNYDAKKYGLHEPIGQAHGTMRKMPMTQMTPTIYLNSDMMVTMNGEEHGLHEAHTHEKDVNDSNDLPELRHDGGLRATPLVHQLDRRVLVGERETALHL